jgi:hypothetical protein
MIEKQVVFDENGSQLRVASIIRASDIGICYLRSMTTGSVNTQYGPNFTIIFPKLLLHSERTHCKSDLGCCSWRKDKELLILQFDGSLVQKKC